MRGRQRRTKRRASKIKRQPSHNRRILRFRGRDGRFVSRPYARRYPRLVRRTFLTFSKSTGRFVRKEYVSKRKDIQILRELYETKRVRRNKYNEKIRYTQKLSEKGARIMLAELKKEENWTPDQFLANNYLRWYQSLLGHEETAHLVGPRVKAFTELRTRHEAEMRELGFGKGEGTV